MNKLYLIYRYNEYGDKEYYFDSETGLLFSTFDFQEIGEKIYRLGGFSDGWECDIFYNPVQD